MNTLKRHTIYPVVRDLILKGSSYIDIVATCTAQHNVARRTVDRAIKDIKKQMATEGAQDALYVKNLLFERYEKLLYEAEQLEDVRTRIEQKRRICDSIRELYGFGKITINAEQINVPVVIVSEHIRKLFSPRDSATGV